MLIAHHQTSELYATIKDLYYTINSNKTLYQIDLEEKRQSVSRSVRTLRGLRTMRSLSEKGI